MDNHTSQSPVPSGFDETRPSSALIYDYFLYGNQHRPIDVQAGREVLRKVPETHYLAHANRGFLQRAAGVMARAGIRQFLDVGAGLPTQWNTHEVVQVVDPDATVVYVDNDPMVVAHSEELLRRRGETNVSYIEADVCDPGSILGHPEVQRRIDFSKPVGWMFVALFHFIAPKYEPYRLFGEYIDASAAGSFVALSHITSDGQQKAKIQRCKDVYAATKSGLHFRTVPEIDRFFTGAGLEYLPPYEGAEPALSFVEVWGSKNPSNVDPAHTWFPCGVARKQ